VDEIKPSIEILDRPTYTEALIGPGKLPDWAYVDLAARTRTFLDSPLLVVWEAESADDVDILQTFNLGMALADSRVRIAIVFGRRDIKQAGRFTELVARNRGARVRTFGDISSAKAWLGVD